MGNPYSTSYPMRNMYIYILIINPQFLKPCSFCDVNQNTQHQPTKTHLSWVCFCLSFPFGGNTHSTDSQNFATLPSRRQQRGSWIGGKKRQGKSRPFAEIRNGADMPGLRDNFETVPFDLARFSRSASSPRRI